MKPHNARFGSIRFPIALPIRYKAKSPVMAVFGIGQTSLMSSTELVFTSDHPIEPGMNAEICLAWPVLLNESVRLQLVLQTVIARSEGCVAAARIIQYHFRTRGAWEGAPPATDSAARFAPLYANQAATVAGASAHP